MRMKTTGSVLCCHCPETLTNSSPTPPRLSAEADPRENSSPQAWMTASGTANPARATSTPAESPAISQQALQSFVLQPVCVWWGGVGFRKIKSGV